MSMHTMQDRNKVGQLKLKTDHGNCSLPDQTETALLLLQIGLGIIYFFRLYIDTKYLILCIIPKPK